MALPSSRRMREHVRDLARDMNVTVVYVGGVNETMWGQAQTHPYDIYEQRMRRLILLSHRPVTPMAYMIAMHELGHCVPGSGWSGARTLEREAAAWEWAVENAILPASLAAHHARNFMISYREREKFSRSERFERLYVRVTRNSRPHRQRKRKR